MGRHIEPAGRRHFAGACLVHVAERRDLHIVGFLVALNMSAADANADAKRERLKQDAQIKNKLRQRTKVGGYGLKFVAGGDGVRKRDPLAARVAARSGGKRNAEAPAQAALRAGSDDVRDEHGV